MGWSDGAGHKSINPRGGPTDDYERGYRDGRVAAREAAEAEAARLGVTLSVVTLADAQAGRQPPADGVS
jgi:hypothetical protein